MIMYKTLGKQGKAPTIWLDVVGHRTSVSELADIFHMHHVTLRNRLKSGWPISAACTISAENNWNVSSIREYVKSVDLDTNFVTVLNAYFAKQNA